MTKRRRRTSDPFHARLGVIYTEERYVKAKATKRRKEQVKELKKVYGKPLKEVAKIEDIPQMVEFVLETGNSGTKAIKHYANQLNKSHEWRKETAQLKLGKGLKRILDNYTEHSTILSLKANHVYDIKDIENRKSLTGSLTKLSKQMEISGLIENQKSRIAELEGMLAMQASVKDIDKNNLKMEAIKLKKDGKTVRDIAKILGISKSSASKLTKDGELTRHFVNIALLQEKTGVLSNRGQA